MRFNGLTIWILMFFTTLLMNNCRTDMPPVVVPEPVWVQEISAARQFWNQKQWSEAEKHFQQALKISTDEKNMWQVAYSHDTLATFYRLREKPRKAADHYKQAFLGFRSLLQYPMWQLNDYLVEMAAFFKQQGWSDELIDFVLDQNLLNVYQDMNRTTMILQPHSFIMSFAELPLSVANKKRLAEFQLRTENVVDRLLAVTKVPPYEIEARKATVAKEYNRAQSIYRTALQKAETAKASPLELSDCMFYLGDFLVNFFRDPSNSSATNKQNKSEARNLMVRALELKLNELPVQPDISQTADISILIHRMLQSHILDKRETEKWFDLNFSLWQRTTGNDSVEAALQLNEYENYPELFDFQDKIQWHNQHSDELAKMPPPKLTSAHQKAVQLYAARMKYEILPDAREVNIRQKMLETGFKDASFEKELQWLQKVLTTMKKNLPANNSLLMEQYKRLEHAYYAQGMLDEVAQMQTQIAEWEKLPKIDSSSIKIPLMRNLKEQGLVQEIIGNPFLHQTMLDYDILIGWSLQLWHPQPGQ